MVSFDVTKADSVLIGKIVNRAMQNMDGVAADERLSLHMDVTATHANGCPLQLQRLLDAPEFDFWHDINGIQRFLNRETGGLTNHFLPRCAAPQVEA